MTRWLALPLAVFGLLLVFPVAVAGGEVADGGETARSESSTDAVGVARAAGELSTLTGTAVSPLVVLAVVGTVRYWNTPSAQRGGLPWHSSPWFWGPVIGVLVAVLAKDTIGAAVPVLKKPLDCLELLENKASGLVALPIMTAAFADALAAPLGRALEEAVLPSALAAGPDVVGAVGAVAHAAGWTVAALVGASVFVVVWLAAHTVNVLVLLNPFAFLDIVLKGARVWVVAILAVVSWVNPWLGALMSLAVLVVAWLIVGWAFRLMIFGAIFSFDVLLGGRVGPEAGVVRGFSGRDLTVVPRRTWGMVRRSGDGLEFRYRPWMVFAARTLPVPSETLAIGRGLINAALLSDADPAKPQFLAVLPPRYRGREQAVAEALGAMSVRDIGVRRGIRAVRTWLGEALGSVRRRLPRLSRRPAR